MACSQSAHRSSRHWWPMACCMTRLHIFLFLVRFVCARRASVCVFTFLCNERTETSLIFAPITLSFTGKPILHDVRRQTVWTIVSRFNVNHVIVCVCAMDGDGKRISLKLFKNCIFSQLQKSFVRKIKRKLCGCDVVSVSVYCVCLCAQGLAPAGNS